MWKRDLRPDNIRRFGDFAIYSETDPERETAHVVVFPDGREIRVLPDGTSGHARALAVRTALEAVNDQNGSLVGDTAVLVVIGALSRAGLTWQELQLVPPSPFEEWLVGWWEDDNDLNPTVLAIAIEQEWEVSRG